MIGGGIPLQLVEMVKNDVKVVNVCGMQGENTRNSIYFLSGKRERCEQTLGK